MEIRPATAADLAKFYGKPVAKSVRGYVGIIEGRVVGAAGVYYDGDNLVAFSEMSDEVKSRRKDIVRMTRLVMGMIMDKKLPVIALCMTDASAKFLEKLGFKKECDAPLGEVYKWQ